MDGNPFQGHPGGELADTIQQLHAAECAIRRTLLQVIAAYDHSGDWRHDGAASMSGWLTAQLGITHLTATEWVATGHELDRLPAIAQAFDEARLSWDKTRALGRAATADTDAELAAQAERLSASQTHTLARRIRAAREAADTHTDRYLRLRWDPDRAWLRIHGRLPATHAATIEKAVTRLADQSGPDPTTNLYEPWDVRCADALTELAGASLAADPDPDLATLVVHVDATTLTTSNGWAEIEHGPLISPATARRLACDARHHLIADGTNGQPLGVGRTTRRIPPWLNRLIRQRDQGCRFPGCQRTRWAHAHHLIHWADGGPTDLHNLASLCAYHHRLVHEGGWHIVGDPNGELMFIRPDGRPYQPRPQPLRPHVRSRLVDAVVPMELPAVAWTGSEVS